MTQTALKPDAEWVATAQAVARGIRRRVLDYTVRHNGGYLSQACSSAEILATLYTRLMNLGPSRGEPVPPPFAGVPGSAPHRTGAAYNGGHEPDRDRFYLSPAHYALVLYAALVETGRMAADGLEQFNRDGSTVEMIGAEHSPGMEVTTGSLAQGLAQAVGVALARRRRGDTGLNWVLLSDGEWQEGQTWETLEVMAHYQVDNVRIYVDVNGQQCDGRMTDVLDLGDLVAKVAAFGATVREVDAHDVRALADAADAAEPGRPLVVLARSCPWQGIPLLQARAPKLHYVRFRDADERQQYADQLASLS
jgi:transketolase